MLFETVEQWLQLWEQIEQSTHYPQWSDHTQQSCGKGAYIQFAAHCRVDEQKRQQQKKLWKQECVCSHYGKYCVQLMSDIGNFVNAIEKPYSNNKEQKRKGGYRIALYAKRSGYYPQHDNGLPCGTVFGNHIRTRQHGREEIKHQSRHTQQHSIHSVYLRIDPFRSVHTCHAYTKESTCSPKYQGADE